MNYIEVIKAVWKWYQSSILEPNDYCLMMRLIAISNDDMGWENCFLRNNYELVGSTKLSYKQFHLCRNKLQQVGLITFDQRNGLPNCRYEIHFETILSLSLKSKLNGKKKEEKTEPPLPNLSQKSKGNAKVRQRLRQGEGVDKLNQTKLNQTKHFSPADKSAEPIKTDLVYWKGFIENWHVWYKTKFDSGYSFLNQDFAHLKKIYKFLENRATQKQKEFTEQVLLDSFQFFLEKAWHKDDWLRKNFTISNVLSQFNSIVNAKNFKDTGAAAGNHADRLGKKSGGFGLLSEALGQAAHGNSGSS